MSHVPQKITPSRDLKECAICTRRFTLDRINAHEAICKSSSAVTRKRFDVTRQRNTGTEVERFANAAAKNGCPSRAPKSSPCVLSTNWRRKHEELIEKINEARKKTEKKPKVNDLPLPPPMDSDDDYVQCPHCLRPFNQQSASRHINTCASRMMCKSKSKTSVIDAKMKPSQPTTE